MRCRTCRRDIGASAACDTLFHPRRPRAQHCLACMRCSMARGEPTPRPAAVAAPPSTTSVPRPLFRPLFTFNSPVPSASAGPQGLKRVASTSPTRWTPAAAPVPLLPSTQRCDATAPVHARPAPPPHREAGVPAASRAPEVSRDSRTFPAPALQAGMSGTPPENHAGVPAAPNAPTNARDSPPSPPPELEAGMCRICHEEETEPALIAPCACAGSSRLVHASCLSKWQQQGHVRECEVCHAAWRCGDLGALNAPNDVTQLHIFSACTHAVVDDDGAELRRRLPPSLVREQGPKLIALAVLSGAHAAFDALLDMGADPVEARCELIAKEQWKAVRLLTNTGRVPPFQCPDIGTHDTLPMYKMNYHLSIIWPGDHGLLGDRTPHGRHALAAAARDPRLRPRSAWVINCITAAGDVDVNAPRHRLPPSPHILPTPPPSDDAL